MTQSIVRKGDVGQAGNPGQFAQGSYDEAEESVGFDFDAEVHNEAGTWMYPPKPMTAEQHIAFWERAAPPDSVLLQAQRDYGAMVERERRQKIEPLREDFNKQWRKKHQQDLPMSLWNYDPSKYGAPTLSPKKQAAWDEWAARRDAAWEQELERIDPPENRPPEVIYDFDVRDVLRASRMYEGAGWLGTREEQKKVLDHYMPALGMTVRDVWKTYRFPDWYYRN